MEAQALGTGLLPVHSPAAPLRGLGSAGGATSSRAAGASGFQPGPAWIVCVLSCVCGRPSAQAIPHPLPRFLPALGSPHWGPVRLRRYRHRETPTTSLPLPGALACSCPHGCRRTPGLEARRPCGFAPRPPAPASQVIPRKQKLPSRFSAGRWCVSPQGLSVWPVWPLRLLSHCGPERSRGSEAAEARTGLCTRAFLPSAIRGGLWLVSRQDVRARSESLLLSREESPRALLPASGTESPKASRSSQRCVGGRGCRVPCACRFAGSVLAPAGEALH